MMPRRRKIVVAVAVMAFYGYVVYRGASESNDFRHQYGAAHQLWKTGTLHLEAQPRYPVTLHLMLAPLTALPLPVASAVWSIALFAAVAAIPVVLARLTGIAPRQQLAAWALAGPFFIDALVLGQSDPMNFLLVAAGLLAAKEGNGIRGAGLIGLAGMIKLLPIVQWAALVARRCTWDVWLGMALTALLGFSMVVAVIGWRPAVSAFHEQANWLQTQEKPWHLVARGADLRPNNESLPITLARTFGDLDPTLRDRHIIALAHFPMERIWMAWYAILGVMSIAWLASIVPAGLLEPGRGWLATFALTSIFMLASTPVAWHHYALWTLPAALFLIDRTRLLLALAVLSLIISAIPSARGLGGHMMIALRAVWTCGVRSARGGSAEDDIKCERR